jgi:hypothetical protein
MTNEKPTNNPTETNNTEPPMFNEAGRRLLAALLSYQMRNKSIDYTLKNYVPETVGEFWTNEAEMLLRDAQSNTVEIMMEAMPDDMKNKFEKDETKKRTRDIALVLADVLRKIALGMKPEDGPLTRIADGLIHWMDAMNANTGAPHSYMEPATGSPDQSGYVLCFVSAPDKNIPAVVSGFQRVLDEVLGNPTPESKSPESVH